MRKHVKILLALFCTINLICQNDFKIGIIPMNGPNNAATPSGAGFVTQPKVGGNYTSILGLLAEDGFNFVRLYSPTIETRQQFKDWLTLIGNSGMQAMTSFNDMAYKLDRNFPANIGTNVYDLGDAVTNNTYFLNAVTAFNEVYNIAPYNNIIWGHTMIGEYNPHSPYPYLGPRTSTTIQIGNSNDYGQQLMPLSKAQEQFSFYNSLKAAGNNQKLINVPGAHNGHLQVDPSNSDSDPDAYMRQYLSSSGMGDVCYDAGYFSYAYNTINNSQPFQAQRYLWKMGNID